MEIGTGRQRPHDQSEAWDTFIEAAMEHRGQWTWVKTDVLVQSGSNLYTMAARNLVRYLGIEISISDGNIMIRVPEDILSGRDLHE